jgi:hypothetical protein
MLLGTVMLVATLVKTIVIPTPPRFFHKLILEEVKVVCFDTLLQVLILKGLQVNHNRVTRSAWRLAFPKDWP